MIVDMHVHTEFSCDSDAKMENYLRIAQEKQVDGICFTDHVDFNKNDYGYGYYRAEEYFAALAKAKSCGSCMALSGMEFSEPYLYQREFEALKQYPYDFIIGSIHWIGDMFPCREVRERYSAGEFYALYWEEVLKTVEAGGFQCLGHIDFPKRYYGEIVYEEKMLRRIFETMLKQNMILEINTSSIRKGIPECMPGAEILQLYRECGGRFVTIGSDAHCEEDLAADFGQADQLVQKAGLQKVYFRERRMLTV